MNTLGSLYNNIAIISSIIVPIFEILIVVDMHRSELYHPYLSFLFKISLINLCACYILYAIVGEILLWTFTKIQNKYLDKLKFLLNFFILLLISPFIPIICHFTLKNEDSFISKFIDTHLKGFFETRAVKHEDIDFIDDQHDWIQWQARSFIFHLPFIIQFILQILPQCVIQLMLLPHGDYNYHLSISLFLHIITALMKILPAAGFSLNSISIHFILFDYLCISTDFLMLFAIIAISNASHIIYNILYFKLKYIIFILYIWSCLGLVHDALIGIYDDINGSTFKKSSLTFLAFLFLCIPIALCLPLFCFFIEMGCFTWILLVFSNPFRFRIEFIDDQTMAVKLWNEFYQFINNAFSKQDTIVRLCTVNHVLIKHLESCGHVLYDSDTEVIHDELISSQRFPNLLKTQKYLNLYKNVTLKSFHDINRIGKECNYFYYVFHIIYCFGLHEYENRMIVSWNNYKPLSLIKRPMSYLKWCAIHNREVLYWKLFVYILGPYYALSRLLNIFVMFYILYQVIFCVETKIGMLFEKYLLLKGLLMLFCITFSGMVIFGIITFKRSYCIEWNILPGLNGMHQINVTQIFQNYQQKNNKVMNGINRDYVEIIDIPKREQLIHDKFGSNVGGIILQYIGRFCFITDHVK
eukprot:468045_1